MNWTAPAIFIHATDQLSSAKAQQLACETGLPLATEPPTGWRLQLRNNALQLARPDGLSVQINFVDGKAIRRASESNFKKQPLARALGLQKWQTNNPTSNTLPTVIDATAGFGTDAWMMASLGCSVTLLEQSQVLYLLLSDAIGEAKTNSKTESVAHALNLVNTNSIEYLLNPATVAVDVVYLDPMYPAARKQALVKKGMQLLHELIGPDDNGPALLKAALSKSTYRVVVKRPKGAPLLKGAEDWCGQTTHIESPNTRYDVYHTSTSG